ncbi:MAG: hypothetical protein LBV19_04380 [Streptococcaceae bacterium]|jgi:hypothetical protein|nr:hypothetical protein [Streptococcaceae bacterium]
MTIYPKIVKAEMIGGPTLVCHYENGKLRYFPINEQIELYMTPADVTHFKETHGANLFISGGAALTWMGNDILIEDNGDVRVNKKIFPAEMIWKYGKKSIVDPNYAMLEKASELKHPILAGFRNVSGVYIVIGIILLIVCLGILIAGFFE